MIKEGSPPLLILCRCLEKAPQRLELSAVAERLRGSFPGLMIEVAAQPCKDPLQIARAIEELRPSALIVGMCSGEEYQRLFEEAVAKTVLPPFFVEFVDILSPAPASLSAEATLERAVLLIGAALRHQAAFKEVPESAIRPRRMSLTGKISRRSLLSGPFQRCYEVIPWIDPEACVWQRGCHLCRRACPVEAIRIQPWGMSINGRLCLNCGQCLPVCPVEAIAVPGFRRSELSPVLAHLCRSSLPVRVLTFVIGAAKAEWQRLAQQQMPHGAGLVPLFLPYVGLLSICLFLEPFLEGVDGLVVICERGPQHRWSPSLSVGQLVGLTNRLLQGAGWRGKRALALDANRMGQEEVTTALKQFVDRLAIEAQPCPSKGSPPLDLAINHEAGRPFWVAFTELWQAKPASTLEPIHSPASPLGMVSLAADKCSGCGVCADRCPTGALARQTHDGLIRFTFLHRACGACGICQSLCPDEAIEVGATIHPDTLLRGERIELAAFPVARCPSCHELMDEAPRLEVLLRKLSPATVQEGLRQVISLCRRCREQEMVRSARPRIWGMGG